MTEFDPHTSFPSFLPAEYRFIRTMPWDLLPRIEGHCSWCGKPTDRKPGRTFRRNADKPNVRWCSSTCRTEALIRWSPQIMAAETRRRDNGICASCGIDSEWLNSRLREIAKINRCGSLESYSYIYSSDYGAWTGGYKPTTSLWEAEHVIPVSMGGGCCGLQNIITLCQVCHKRSTAKVKANLARAKRAQLELAI